METDVTIRTFIRLADSVQAFHSGGNGRCIGHTERTAKCVSANGAEFWRVSGRNHKLLALLLALGVEKSQAALLNGHGIGGEGRNRTDA